MAQYWEHEGDIDINENVVHFYWKIQPPPTYCHHSGPCHLQNGANLFATSCRKKCAGDLCLRLTEVVLYACVCAMFFSDATPNCFIFPAIILF